MTEATGLTITYGVILFYPNFFFFAVPVLLNIVLLQLKQGSSPLSQWTIAESSDVSREYFTLITEKSPLHENQEGQSYTYEHEHSPEHHLLERCHSVICIMQKHVSFIMEAPFSIL